MSANLIFIVTSAIAFVASLAAVAASLKWGLAWRRIAAIGWWKAIGLHLVLVLLTCILAIAAILVLSVITRSPSDLMLQAISTVIALIASTIAIAFIYKTRIHRAALSLVPYFVVTSVVSYLLSDASRKYVFEAFYIPTNSMAPTLLGEHLTAACPRCGAPAYGATHAMSGRTSGPVLMVCSKELKSVWVDSPPNESISGDRLLACKLLEPRRWDLIVFRLPENPAVIYTKRVVGMPGETLAIHDGAVWINGERAEPPASIQNISFEPTVKAYGEAIGGPGSGEVKLAADEYYVLGDFVDGASDSRFWKTGAPGHPPYAVPVSHVVGVAINIYWPVSRWTSFR